MAPAGVVGPTGADGGADGGPGMADGGDNVGACLGVGKLGSDGPAPGPATGLPSMVEPQPETNKELARMAANISQPPVKPRRALRDDRTRCSRKSPNVRG